MDCECIPYKHLRPSVIGVELVKEHEIALVSNVDYQPLVSSQDVVLKIFDL